MSSSKGNPSNKMGWYKSMEAKLNRTDKLKAAAAKVAEGGESKVQLPTVKNEQNKPAAVQLFEQLVAQAKIDRQRRLDKEASKQKQKAQEKKA